MIKKAKAKVKTKTKYPSAVMLQQTCYEDYSRLISTFDKIYDKINITLAFCGVVLFIILGKFDFTIIIRLFQESDSSRFFILLIYVVCMFSSSVFILIAVIKLLLLMKSRTLDVIDSIAIRNDEIYNYQPDEAALWLIDKYTLIINTLRIKIADKQKQFDVSVIFTVIAIISYSIILIIEKGL